jgi:hypothetical protein
LPAAATGILGAAVLPLAVTGLDRRAEWLLRSAPRARRSLALRSGLAGVIAGAAVAVTGVGASASVAQALPSRALALVPLACMVFGAGLLAGAIVPWHLGRAVEQLGSFAALAVLAGGLSFGLARLAPFVHAESGFGAAVLGASALAACGLAAAELAGGAA